MENSLLVTFGKIPSTMLDINIVKHLLFLLVTSNSPSPLTIAPLEGSFFTFTSSPPPLSSLLCSM